MVCLAVSNAYAVGAGAMLACADLHACSTAPSYSHRWRGHPVPAETSGSGCIYWALLSCKRLSLMYQCLQTVKTIQTFRQVHASFLLGFVISRDRWVYGVLLLDSRLEQTEQAA